MPGVTDREKGYGLLITVSALVVLLDQITKTVVTRLLSLHQTVEVINGFFNIVYIKNPGAAFGILRGWGAVRTVLLILISLAALAVIVYLYGKTTGRLASFALSLIAGGAVGNLIDRVRFGEVIDFLDFSLCGYHWPAFNLADSAITVGVTVTVILACLKRG
ncbi:MAG: signal peptidase II [Thermodesulfobacteriota bacterium]